VALRPRLWPGVPWTWKVHGVWGSVQPLGVMADRTTSPLLNRIGRSQGGTPASRASKARSVRVLYDTVHGRWGLSARLLTTPAPRRISPLAP
jgi:hypothetical protein